MRIFSTLAIVCLAACTSGAEEPTGDSIACAVDGASEYTETCTAERWQVEGTMYLVVRHPDGGFRRFEVLPEGRGLAAADGMEDARIELNGDVIEAQIAEDRYRIPVTPGKGTAALPAAEKTEDVSSVSDEKAVECAVDGSSQFSAICTYEVIQMAEEHSVLVRHPDGGFRRFAAGEGGSFAPADGASFATISSGDGVTQIEVNQDVYRIPEGILSDGAR